MKVQDAMRELSGMVSAKLPIIEVVSFEERRVQEALAAVAKSQRMELWLWSITTGVRKANSVDAEPIQDPGAILTWIRERQGRHMIVLRDFEPFIDGPNAVTAVRQLRELGEDLPFLLASEQKVVVLLGTRLVVPDSCRNLISVLEWPLPDQEELEANMQEGLRGIAKTRPGAVPTDEVERTSLAKELAASVQGLTAQEADNAIALCAATKGSVKSADAMAFKKQLVTRLGLVDWLEPIGGLEMVGGLELFKTWLVQRQRGFSPEAKAYGLPTPKGVAAIGPPGTGKSLLAKSVGSGWSYPVLGMNFGRLKGSLLGESQKNLRAALRTAEAVAPCVLLVDEIDKGLGGSDSSGASTDGGTSQDMLGMFLTWMQEKSAPVFVVATMNRTTGLPPELLRRGRWDAMFHVDLPHVGERRQIWDVHLRRRGRDPEQFDLATLSSITDGYSGAEIESVVVDAMYDAFAAGAEVTTEHMFVAVKRCVPLSKTAREQIDEMRKWAVGRTMPASLPPSEATTGGRFNL